MKWATLLLTLFNQLRGKATATVTSERAKELQNKLLWEAVAIALTFLIGYLVSHCTNQSVLESCQDEREALLKKNSQHQAMLDSLHYAAKIAQKDQQILQKDETILLLQQRLRSDSIAHLSELEAIRAINATLRRRQP
ncbi:MAG: hypothetical protein LCH91_05355 [Bacteroidetes bacterium]|nr:hypothetical protein [Bacteroidota bacterium]